MNKILGIIITFNLVNIFWIFFRANNIKEVIKIIKGMFDLGSIYMGVSIEYMQIARYSVKLLLLLIISMLIVFLGKNTIKRANEIKFNIINRIETLLYLMLCIFIVLSDRVSTFLYFNF